MSQPKQKAPAFLLYARDFTSGTAHLSPAEVGAYMRCLCYQWECGGVPAEDTVRLARIVGTSVVETTPLWDVISIKFEKRGDGLYWNRRLESVRSGNSSWVDQRRAAGKARAAKAQRGQRGQFSRCKTGNAVPPVTPVRPVTPSTSAAGAPLVESSRNCSETSPTARSAGHPLVVPLDASLVVPLDASLVVPLVEKPQNHSEISKSDQRTTSDPLPLPYVQNLEQRPDGRDLSSSPPQTPTQLARQPASDGNYAVVLKLVHTLIDEQPGLTGVGDIADAVKWRCAETRIAYDSDVVARAVASATARRRLTLMPADAPEQRRAHVRRSA